jgi:hypothetical protein
MRQNLRITCINKLFNRGALPQTISQDGILCYTCQRQAFLFVVFEKVNAGRAMRSSAAEDGLVIRLGEEGVVMQRAGEGGGGWS